MQSSLLRVLIFVASCTLQGVEPSVAIVMDIQGAGRMRAVGVEDPLVLLSELKTGGEIHLSKGARVIFVTLVSGEEIQVEGPAVFRLDKRGHPEGQVHRTVKPVQALQMASNLRPGGLAQASLVMREVEDSSFIRDHSRVISPQFSLQRPPSPATLEARPHFQWNPMAGVSWEYLVQDVRGQEYLHVQGPSSEAVLPRGKFLKAGETYTWRLTGSLPDGTRQQASGTLRRLDQKESDVLKQARTQAGASFAHRVLYAALLEKANLLAEARAEWGELLKERPDDPTLTVKAKASR